MTLESFAKRLGVSRQAAHQIEMSEASESITVKRLRSAADALGCDLVISIVPRHSLTQTVRDQALNVATQRMKRINHSMALEQQSVAPERLRQMAEEIADDLVERGGSALWE